MTGRKIPSYISRIECETYGPRTVKPYIIIPEDKKITEEFASGNFEKIRVFLCHLI